MKIKHDWIIDELQEIYDLPLLDLISKSHGIHVLFHQPAEIQVCSLISVKTGGCPEDCKYCAQSSRYQTSVSAQPMMSLESVLGEAKRAKERGATRVCLGAAWRGVKDGKQFEEVLQMIKEITEMGVEVCCTLGMLKDHHTARLKEARLYAYNHNLDSSEQFPLPPPPIYSNDSNSVYMKQAKEVYEQSSKLTKEQKDIARYWDDNPFVMEHAGHMLFANKKITPGGHWIGITTIACKKTKADAVKTAQAYAMTAVAMYDAFICCWQTKYKTNYIRPVTIINEKFDKHWLPSLQTPPFPEYPSGHSTITRAAAVMLTKLFGENFSFQDTSDLKYIGMQRHFNSFVQAADEASISRFYGGIHFVNSVNAGAGQGKLVSDYISKKIKLKE